MEYIARWVRLILTGALYAVGFYIVAWGLGGFWGCFIPQ